MNIGDKCTFCGNANLVYVNGYEPHSIDHLACPLCNSTYPLPRYVTVKLFGGTALRTTVNNMEILTKALAQCLYFDEGLWKGDMAIKSKTYD